MVLGFSVAEKASSLSFYGESASNSHRLYVVDLKKDASKLEEDLNGELKDVLLGECKAWDFVNSRGDTICGRYYLPPHFDPNKKYPMIVNYYGGCSPTSRNFASRIRSVIMWPTTSSKEHVSLWKLIPLSTVRKSVASVLPMVVS